MDWVMCLLPFAVCFVGFLAAAKVTKRKSGFWLRPESCCFWRLHSARWPFTGIKRSRSHPG